MHVLKYCLLCSGSTNEDSCLEDLSIKAGEFAAPVGITTTEVQNIIV